MGKWVVSARKRGRQDDDEADDEAGAGGEFRWGRTEWNSGGGGAFPPDAREKTNQEEKGGGPRGKTAPPLKPPRVVDNSYPNNLTSLFRAGFRGYPLFRFSALLFGVYLLIFFLWRFSPLRFSPLPPPLG